MKDGDKWKAVFWTNHRLFEPLVMFFELTNSPAMFQTRIFEKLMTEGTIVVHLDDILIFTDTLEQHWEVTCWVIQLLYKHNLFLKPDNKMCSVMECAVHQTKIQSTYWDCTWVVATITLEVLMQVQRGFCSPNPLKKLMAPWLAICMPKCERFQLKLGKCNRKQWKMWKSTLKQCWE